MENTIIEARETEAVEAVEVVEVKPYTLRKLNASDVFTFSSILKQIGFKEFKDSLQSEETKGMISALTNKEDNAAIEKIGLSLMLDIAGIIISNLDSAKDSIFKLLSDLSGLTKDEVATLDMEVFVEMIIDVFKQEGFRNFFKVVSKLF